MVLITAAIAIIGDIVFRMGTAGARKWFAPREELRVKLLSTEAKIPTRGSEHAAGLDLYSIIETMVPPGDSVLVKTGIALELPPGSYGRIALRSSLAIRGIETGAGVVDRDFRGEIKVLLKNHSDVDLRIYKGDRVAQIVVEKIMELDVRCVEELNETTRGSRIESCIRGRSLTTPCTRDKNWELEHQWTGSPSERFKSQVREGRTRSRRRPVRKRLHDGDG